MCSLGMNGYYYWKQEYLLLIPNILLDMLYTIAAILIVLWLLGLVTSYTIGGFIHLLLVIAIVVVLVRIIQGRNPIQ